MWQFPVLNSSRHEYFHRTLLRCCPDVKNSTKVLSAIPQLRSFLAEPELVIGDIFSWQNIFEGIFRSSAIKFGKDSVLKPLF
jgi:hypothetical protein